MAKKVVSVATPITNSGKVWPVKLGFMWSCLPLELKMLLQQPLDS